MTLKSKVKKFLLGVILICLFGLVVVPLANLYFLGRSSLTVDPWAHLSLDQLGQLGDFFGGHTAAISGLLSVALILYFSNQQSELQQRHFEEQLRISKQASDLASITNIYEHYGESYGGRKDVSEVLSSVAKGHRRWAIRESFSIIDPDGALESRRKEQVESEFLDLIRELGQAEFGPENFRRAADLTSSLLLDRRLDNSRRKDLWEIYEVLRKDPVSLVTTSSELQLHFHHIRQKLSEKHRAADA